MKRAFAYALRHLRHWRSNREILILTLAIAIAAGASSAVSLFTERMNAAIASQTGETLGADLVFRHRDALPDTLVQQVRATGAQTANSVSFPSVVLLGDNSALASIKAVSTGFPLRGRMLLTQEPFGAVSTASDIPAPGDAWVDLRLWQELKLSLGSVVKAGAREFRIVALIAEEPGRGAGFSDLAPRLMINDADLAATQLLGPGSRAQYWLMAAGSPAQLAALNQLELPQGIRLVAPQDARPELKTAMNTAGEFLGIARVAAALLAAAAIALCAWQHGLKLRDEVALLKCLGAQGGFILTSLLMRLLLLGLVGGFVGVLLGYGTQELIVRLLGELMQITLPPASLWPVFEAWGLSLVLLAGFAAAPVLRARAASPIRVFQRVEVESNLSRGLPLVTALGVGALLYSQTSSIKSAGYVLGGAVITAAVLALLAWLMVRLLAPLRLRGGVAWRFGLGNLVRRGRATVWQSVAFGLALLSLLLITVVRQDLLVSWQGKLGPEAPNQFLINIQPDQVEPLKKFFAERDFPDLKLWPMARARLIAINGTEVTPQSFDDPETQRWINREFNLSWTDSIGSDNRVTEGEWWGEAGHNQPFLSADHYARDRLKLKLGDRLTLDFAGIPVELTVKNFRTVEWDSFKPNFFLLASTGVLDAVPAQWITSFHLPVDQRQLLRDLVTEFPNITAIDMELMIGQIRSMMERITTAVELLFLFTLAAGLMVLLAAMESTRGERARETALLRTLGASRGIILRGLLAEYAGLGLLAGSVAATVAQLGAWILAEQVFRLEYGLRPMFWLVGAGGGALLVMGLGWLTLRNSLNTPPKDVLAMAG